MSGDIIQLKVKDFAQNFFDNRTGKSHGKDPSLTGQRRKFSGAGFTLGGRCGSLAARRQPSGRL